MTAAKEIPTYYKYWGKVKKDIESESPAYHLLPYHSLDVAAVGKLLLDIDKPLTKSIAVFLDITAQQLQSLFVFFLALHDLGKFASAFQGLYQHNSSQLLKIKRCKSYDGRSYRHDRLGFYFWDVEERILINKIVDINNLDRHSLYYTKTSFRVLLNTVLGHHGQPIESSDVRSIRQFTEKNNLYAVFEFIDELVRLLKPQLPIEKFQLDSWIPRLQQVSWQLAGIAVLADWIGSDSSHFHYCSQIVPLEEYWQKAKLTAEKALSKTDLNKVPIVSPFSSVKKHFGFEPTPLQKWAEKVKIDESPQLFILEDITGSGKTEAALVLTHRLMQQGAADGFYFGLPTMATSNAMFSRVAQHYQQMLSVSSGKPSIVLAHGARDMNTLFREAVLSSDNPDSEYDPTDLTATAQCNTWLADSRKKALLAPVGVGTIDQALLAVLPRRHQSLRLLGLNRKVLIFDEVHAADEFMFELLESLLTMHFHQGGSVILLTATLSLMQRSRLVAIWQRAANLTPQPLESHAFPLATKVSIDAKESLTEIPLTSRRDVTREVSVQFIHSFKDCIHSVLEAVSQHKCVVWVRNSVDDALKAYHAIRQQLENEDDCLLFHSRFILQDRKFIEDKVLQIFGKQSDSRIRAGKVLVATQVFQESLDADTDVLISDICPIDDLIQRTGRLHRHTRDKHGEYQRGITDVRNEPKLWLHCPEWEENPEHNWLSESFRNTQYVYRSPGRLWLTQRVLQKLRAIKMPDEARHLIEAVYSSTAYEQIPTVLQYQEDMFIGEERSKAAKANSQLIEWHYGYCDRSGKWHEDNTDISTRHSDIETVEVVLLKRDSTKKLVPYVDKPNFAIKLSTLKLSKNKYADKLQPVSEQEEQVLKIAYPKAKHLQCWLPQDDTNFSYDSASGFRDTKEKDIL